MPTALVIWFRFGGSRPGNGNLQLICSFIPGFLSLEVKASFDDTQPVFEKTALPATAEQIGSTMQVLLDADMLFERSINISGGERALLRYGMENIRVYLPGMGPAIGARLPVQSMAPILITS